MMTNWKRKLWKYATVTVAVLFALNPEAVSFALFIDAIGLETIVMLLEMQFLAVVSAFFDKIRTIFAYVGHAI
jgi:hypothetical protein